MIKFDLRKLIRGQIAFIFNSYKKQNKTKKNVNIHARVLRNSLVMRVNNLAREQSRSTTPLKNKRTKTKHGKNNQYTK